MSTDPYRTREDRAHQTGALNALRAVRDELAVLQAAGPPGAWWDGIADAIDVVDRAIARRGGTP